MLLFGYQNNIWMIDIENDEKEPEEVCFVTSAIFILSAAYPNPFNPSTSILWDVLDAGNVNIFVRHQFVFVLIIM